MKKTKDNSKKRGREESCFLFLSKNPRGVLLFGAGNGLTNPNAAVYAEGGVKKICAGNGRVEQRSLRSLREVACGYELAECALYRADAQRWAKLHNVLFLETSELIHRCSAYHLKRRQLGFHKSKAVFKITVCGKDSAKLIFDEWYGIRFSLVPALLRLPKGIVIQIFVLCNLGFQRDILSNVEAVSVKKEHIQR